MFDVKEIIFLVIFLALFGMPFILAVLTSKKNKPVDQENRGTKDQ
jgi:hypothetical protein